MIILGIETSCDETALALIRAEGLPVRGRTQTGDSLQVLANITHSQAALHAAYGGVFPNLAKREHSRNLIPLLKSLLETADVKKTVPKNQDIYADVLKNISIDKTREPELWEQFEKFIPTIEKPPIDAIAVTFGPGLEPALWVGINFAKALGAVWGVPILPINHMEGHIFSALLRRKNEFSLSNSSAKGGSTSGEQFSRKKAINYKLSTISYPALSLLISGGHTELVLIKGAHDYEIVGQTRDDAVGEAFDKVARLLGLPYPGGPEISRLAEKARSSLELRASDFADQSPGDMMGIFAALKDAHHAPQYVLRGLSPGFGLPRPMLHSGDYDFSFSGIKTSVLYVLKKLPELTDDIKKEIALEFENAVTEVLVAKTKKVIDHYGARALLLGGGVVANTHIRREFEKLATEQNVPLYIPEKNLTTDNALMIAVAGFLRLTLKDGSTKAQNGELAAKGNLALDKK